MNVITAPTDGVLTRLDALAVGTASWRLGAGRARKEDAVQAGAGILLHAKPGERVRAGQALMSLRTEEPERFARAEQALEGSWEIAEEGRVGDSAGVERRVILDRISAE